MSYVYNEGERYCFPHSAFFGKLLLLSRTGVSLLNIILKWWLYYGCWRIRVVGWRRNTQKCLNEILQFSFIFRHIFSRCFIFQIFSVFLSITNSVRLYRLNKNLWLYQSNVNDFKDTKIEWKNFVIENHLRRQTKLCTNTLKLLNNSVVWRIQCQTQIRIFIYSNAQA